MNTIFYFKDSKIPCFVPGVPSGIFSQLRTGVLEEQIISIDYCDANNEESERDVLPEVLFRYRDDWFFAAFCYLREARRIFRMGRVENARLTGRSDQSHGVAADIRENGLDWEHEVPPEYVFYDGWDDSPDVIKWTNIQLVPGENEPAVQMPNDLDEHDYFQSSQNFRWDFTQSARNSNLQEIRENIAAGADVNYRSGDGSMPLHLATRSGNFEAVKFLIKHGANPSARDGGGNTVLITASRGGNLELIKYLLEKEKGDIHAQNCFGWTPLYCAVMDARLEVVKYYLQAGAEVNMRTRDKETALMLAVGRSFASSDDAIAIAKILIKAGVEINAQDKSGNSALMHAINRDEPKVVDFLLESGASCSVFDKKGNSPLLKVLQNFNVASRYRDSSDSHARAEYTLFTVVKNLLRHQADVNAGNREGVTPLMIAELPMMRVLVSYGANVRAKTNTGKTVAMFHAGNLRTLRFLAEYGADILERDQYGNSVLLLAPASYRLTRYLIEKYGFLVNEKNNCNETILHHACEASDLRLVQYLINRGAGINLNEPQGREIFDYIEERSHHYAPGDYDEEIIEILKACQQ